MGDELRSKQIDEILICVEKGERIDEDEKKKIIRRLKTYSDNVGSASLKELKEKFVEDKRILIVLNPFEFDDDCIKDLIVASNESEHHTFVAPSEEGAVQRYTIAWDYFETSMMLVSTKYLSLVGFGDVEGDTIPKFLEGLVKKTAEYGLQLIKVKETKKNKHKKEQHSNGKILYYLNGLSLMPNGTVWNALGVLKALQNPLYSNYTIEICTTSEIDAYYRIGETANMCVRSQESIIDVYEVIILPWVDLKAEVLSFIDEHGLKWIAWEMDIIDLRFRKNKARMNRAISFFKFVDGLFFFSNDAMLDYKEVFFDNAEYDVIPIPARTCECNEGVKKIDIFDSYILVVGNSYKHKMIPQFIEYVKDTNKNYIVLGSYETGRIAKNIYGFVSGSLELETLHLLYRDCDLVVFPSIYEGFGLPILEALNYGKNVIVVDRPLNHEIESLQKEFEGHIFYYRTYSEMSGLINDLDHNPNIFTCNLYRRTWDDVGADMESMIKGIYSKKKSYRLLEKRHEQFSMIDPVIYVKNKVLKRIIDTDYSKLSIDKVVDIYGRGENGLLLYNNIKHFVTVGCFVDRGHKENIDDDMPETVRGDMYECIWNHILVVVPEQDFEEIKNYYISKNEWFEDNIMTVTEFLKGI